MRALISLIWGVLVCLIAIPINTYININELYISTIEVILISVIFYVYYSNIEFGAIFGVLTGIGCVITSETIRVFSENRICPHLFIIYPFIGLLLGAGISTMKEATKPRGKVFGAIITFFCYLSSIILLYIFKSYTSQTYFPVRIS